jgi:hypothetical protein
MPFVQYTHCIDYKDFKNFWRSIFGDLQDPEFPLLINAGFIAGFYALFGMLGGFLLGGPFTGAITGSIAGSYGFIEGFCDQWLNKRLICIKKDTCAAGRVAWIETTEKKPYYERIFDNDLSFNLQLVPYNGQIEVGGKWVPEFSKDDFKRGAYGFEQIVADGFPAADLLKNPDGWDLNYEGYHSHNDNKPNHPGGRWTLHGEFEGNAMDTIRRLGKFMSLLNPILGPIGGALGALIGFQIAYNVGTDVYEKVHSGCKKVCRIPIVCDIVCFVAAAAAAAAAAVAGLLAGSAIGFFWGFFGGLTFIGTAIIGNWINTDGSFHDAANDPASGEIHEGDCVFISGDLVYDGGHDQGWHEIHPVKHLQKICGGPPHIVVVRENAEGNILDYYDSDCCPSTTSDNFKDPIFKDTVLLFWNRWCEFVQTSQDPIVVSNQGKPENQWCLHPLVDGCGRTQER